MNKYFEGLEKAQKDELKRLFDTAQIYSQDIKLLISMSENPQSAAYTILRTNFIGALFVIDDFMISCKKEPIFDIIALRDMSGGNLAGIDEFMLIEKFDEIAKEKQT